MKKLLYPILLLLASVVFMSSCSNDDDGPARSPITPGTESGFKNLRGDALDELKITKTFDADGGITFTSPNGVVFTFSGNLYDSNWNQITGDVTLEYIEIFDRGNMVAANKPLVGYDEHGNLRPLITGGEFYVNMKQNGQQLQTWDAYQLEIPGALTGGVNDEMILWLGEIDDNGDLFWTQFDGRGEQGDNKGGINSNVETNTYNLFCNEFGWTNVDILASEEGEQTPLLVQVPEGYTNKNASVYVAYKGKPGYLAFLDQYLTVEKLFTEHYGWAPIGYNLYVIFVAESNGQYVYCIKDVTIAKETIIEVKASELKIDSRENVIKKINELP